jgi:hypothetical protein
MPFSANRPAYSDNPSEASHSVIVTTDFPLRLYCAAKIHQNPIS